MPKVEMSIDLDAIWDRYHAGKTTPGDVRRLLLAYDGARTACALLQRDAEYASADLASLRARIEETQARYAALVACWKQQPQYYDDCDPGQNDPYYAWFAEMTRLVEGNAP